MEGWSWYKIIYADIKWIVPATWHLSHHMQPIRTRYEVPSDQQRINQKTCVNHTDIFVNYAHNMQCMDLILMSLDEIKYTDTSLHKYFTTSVWTLGLRPRVHTEVVTILTVNTGKAKQNEGTKYQVQEQ